MKDKSRKALISVGLAVVAAVLIAWAGSQGGSAIGGFPVFALGVAAAMLIQWLVFIPSFAKQTEKFYDLTGALTYISITVFLVLASPGIDARGMLLAAMVVLWALRLGGFLFLRVMKHGKDDRFDELKPDFARYLNTWTLQGLWVAPTAALAWVAITSDKKVGLDGFFWGWPGRVDPGHHRGNHRRRAEDPVQEQPRQPGPLDLHGPLVKEPAPQLLRRNHAVGGRRHHRPARASGLAVGSSRLARVRHPAAHQGQRRPAP